MFFFSNVHCCIDNIIVFIFIFHIFPDLGRSVKTAPGGAGEVGNWKAKNKKNGKKLNQSNPTNMGETSSSAV